MFFITLIISFLACSPIAPAGLDRGREISRRRRFGGLRGARIAAQEGQNGG